MIEGIEGGPGHLMFVGLVQDRIITVRTSPINCALAIKAYIDQVRANWGGNWPNESEARWVMQIWDASSMGQYRTEAVGHCAGTGNPRISDVRALDELADAHVKSVRGKPWVFPNSTQA